VDAWRRAAEEFGKTRDVSGQIESLSSAGVLLLKSKPEEAERLFEEGLAAGGLTPAALGTAREYVKAGDRVSDLGQTGPAKKYYAAAVDLYQKLAPDTLDMVEAYEGLGRMSLEEREDLMKTAQYFEKSLNIVETRAPNSAFAARLHLRMGNVNAMKGDFPEATRHFELSIKLYEQVDAGANDKAIAGGIAGCLNGLGIIAARTGNYFDSRSYFGRALTIRQKYPEDLDTAMMIVNLGNVAKELGDLDGANSYFQHALAIEEKLAPGTLQVAGTLFNIGTIADMQGDYVSANRYLTQALTLQQKLPPDSDYLALLSGGLGDVALHEGDFRQAFEYKKKALEINRKLAPGSLDEADALNALGEIALRKGDFEMAADYLHQALAIAEKIAPKGELTANVLQGLGKVEFDRGRYAAAHEFYQRALEVQQSGAGNPIDSAKILEGLGDLAAHDRRMNEAADFYGQAVGLIEKSLGPDHPDLARGLNGLAEIQAQTGGTDKSFQTALRAEAIGSAHLRLTIQGLSERQALHYAADRPNSLGLLLSLLEQKFAADSEKVEQAWSAVICSRAMVLDEMADRHRALSVGADPALLDLAGQLASCKQRLANLTLRSAGDYPPEVYRKLLDRTRSETEEIERTLSQRSHAFRTQVSRERIGFAEVKDVMPQDTALVAYVRYSRIDLSHPGTKGVPSYAVFILASPSAKPQFVGLGTAKTIDNLWSAWNDSIFREARATLAAGNNETTYRQAAIPLRRTVWDPISSKITNIAAVFVVPDGALQLLNLDSLPVMETRYLADEPMLFHYVSAERDLTVTPYTHGTGLLAFGNPDFNQVISTSVSPVAYRGVAADANALQQPSAFRGSRSSCRSFSSLRFEPLPASGREAEEVSKMWSKTMPRNDAAEGASITLTGSEASELSFRQLSPGKRVLHLATHGFFLEDSCDSISHSRQGPEPDVDFGENPLLLSGLAFAGANHRNGNNDDGIVTAEEIATMNLSGVDLTVLSACDTGRGQVRAGEGVFGLKRAFQLAGANTVVMSLWPVDDEMTREWMLSMYHTRLAEGKETALAVRLANREILKQRRSRKLSTHPFYWAAFIAAGNRD
jgi:CHAT domain-containing protein/tetratricopeptide (TPR) repeat protein